MTVQKEANIAPIFKMGDKHSPSNYRPVSLTCIIAKCMEHIILVSNMMKHLELNNILHPLQHGFRKNYSCETQLLSLFQDLSSNPSQIDLIIMDFSKAFDKVPHRRLNYKLDWYGIRGNTREWILDFPLRQVSEGCSGRGIIRLGTCSLWCSPGHRSGACPVPPVHKRPP